MPTQQQFASQMLDQLRALDPSISGEVGTPERKIIETVAQAMAEAQIDFSVTNAPFDVDAKYGSDIDKMISLFGYGRQLGSRAKGYITFSRSEVATKDIIIPGGTQLMGPTPTNGGYNVMFITRSSVTMAKGSSSVTAPIECVTEGISGNVGANTITDWVGVPIYGVTSVTNETATYGGLDPETDEELKARFKNTVFRNVSGTPDQYLALAMSISGVSVANVIGPISRYRERIQVPSLVDAEDGRGGDPNNENDVKSYTGAISSNKYTKYFYNDIQAFVALDLIALPQLNPDVDFTINSPSKSVGDSYGTTSGIAPNITFKNVYIGATSTKPANSVAPGDVVHFEYSYISTASRNNYDKKVLNCVDLFIDGKSLATTSATVPVPSSAFAFSSSSTSPLYYENYRRIDYNGAATGQTVNSAQRPIVGNYFTPLFQQPTMDLPDSITTSYNSATYTYYKGVHYWAVQDVGELYGTIRARNGIEWSSNVPGQSGTSNLYTGPVIGASVSNVTPPSVQITNYSYDKNVQDLQSVVESAKQVTTDVLAHSGKIRYFKPDVSISYTNGANVSNTNNLIVNNLNYFFKAQPFGFYLQLSDVLQIIHNTPGVDNVDWTYNQSNAPNDPTGISDSPTKFPVVQSSGNIFYTSKISETDQYGNKLGTLVIEPYGNTGLKLYHTMSWDSSYLNTSANGNSNQTYNYSSFVLTFKPGTSAPTATTNTVGLHDITGTTADVSTNLYTISSTGIRLNDSSGVLIGDNSYAGILTGALDLIATGFDTPLWKIKQQKLDGSFNTTGVGILPGYQTPLIFTPLSSSEAWDGNGLFSNGQLDFSAKLIVTSYILSQYDHNGDVALADNEIARLPEGVKDADGNVDVSSVITIRQKPQSNWLH